MHTVLFDLVIRIGLVLLTLLAPGAKFEINRVQGIKRVDGALNPTVDLAAHQLLPTQFLLQRVHSNVECRKRYPRLLDFVKRASMNETYAQYTFRLDNGVQGRV